MYTRLFLAPWGARRGCSIFCVESIQEINLRAVAREHVVRPESHTDTAHYISSSLWSVLLVRLQYMAYTEK